MAMNLTLANKNPFSTFDFLGYFFPGALVLLLIYILTNGFEHLGSLPSSVLKLIVLIETKSIIGGVAIVIIAYVTGHLVSYISSSTVELFYVWCHGYPSNYLLHNNPQLDPILTSKKGRLGICWHIAVCFVLFPIVISHCLFERICGLHRFITKPLNEPLQKELKIAQTMMLHELGIKDETIANKKFDNAHLIVMHYVYEHSIQHQVKFDNYVALYGLLRSLTLIFSLSFSYLLYDYFNHTSFDNLHRFVSIIANKLCIDTIFVWIVCIIVTLILVSYIVYHIYDKVAMIKNKSYHKLDVILGAVAIAVLLLLLLAVFCSEESSYLTKMQLLVVYAFAYFSYLGFGKFYRRFTLENYMALLTYKTKSTDIEKINLIPELQKPIHIVIDKHGLLSSNTTIDINNKENYKGTNFDNIQLI